MVNSKVIFNTPTKLNQQEVQNTAGLKERLNKTYKQKQMHFKGLLVRGIPVLKVLDMIRKLSAVCFVRILHNIGCQTKASEWESGVKI